MGEHSVNKGQQAIIVSAVRCRWGVSDGVFQLSVRH